MNVPVSGGAAYWSLKHSPILRNSMNFICYIGGLLPQPRDYIFILCLLISISSPFFLHFRGGLCGWCIYTCLRHHNTIFCCKSVADEF